MELAIGLIGGLFRYLAFNAVFYAIGSLLLKLITLGRYPRMHHLRDSARQGFPEFELVALLGLLLCVAAVVLAAHRLT